MEQTIVADLVRRWVVPVLLLSIQLYTYLSPEIVVTYGKLMFPNHKPQPGMQHIKDDGHQDLTGPQNVVLVCKINQKSSNSN